MVLYKRKPITPSNAPTHIRADSEVWVMKVTEEAFTNYEHYLQRLDYYNQKHFTCEITGHTNLSFFDALQSETHGSAQVDNNFPEQLREPILRKVQFCLTPRIDALVNQLYDQFKEDFFPGEKVTVELQDDRDGPIQRYEGILKDKVTFPELKRGDVVERPAMSRYFVAIKGRTAEVFVDHKHIFRDRRSFTKHVLRSFLKHTVSRDLWDGAPWLVKESIARQYNIDTTIPSKLQKESILAERQAMASLKKGRPDEQCIEWFQSQGQLPQLAEAARIHKGKLPKGLIAQFEASLVNGGRPINFNAVGNDFGSDTMAVAPIPHRSRPPAIKYPIDDLEIHPRQVVRQRPAHKTFALPVVNTYHNEETSHNTVGILLEIWNTFNNHNSLYQLDTFTFDDFVDALQYQSTDVECELLSEMHCAAMKLLVDESGVLDPYLPSATEETSDDDSTANNSTTSSPAPDEGRRVSGRARTSMLKNDITKTMKANSPKRSGQHRAEEMLGDSDWQSRLMIRDFTDGGWQVILVGILAHMATVLTREKEICERILSILAPIDQKPTKDTARRQYAQLDTELRATALEIVIMLTITSKAMKDSMERRQEQMTEDRKEKVQRQRDRKVLAEDLHALDDERKRLFPEEATPPAEEPAEGTVKSDNSEVKMEDAGEQEADEDIDTDMADSDDDGAASRRRISNRANDLKRKREEDDTRRAKEKQARLEAKASASAQKKVLRDIEAKKKVLRNCEEEILHYDEQLRVNACHRTRVLGRDRFWNRYYWFERNGMPVAPSSDNSTASYGYCNSRIWIQGPDDMERAGFIDLPEPEQAQYRAAFGVTVPQRRDIEEGPTQLKTAYEWGYYDDPAELDHLMSWLDDRGHREKALKKELHLWRDKITEQMEAMHTHLSSIDQKRNAEPEPVVGVATRKKTHVIVGGDSLKHPSLLWRNDTARRELGQLHCEGKIVVEMERKGKRVGREKASATAKKEAGEAMQVDEPVVTRRGTRYR